MYQGNLTVKKMSLFFFFFNIKWSTSLCREAGILVVWVSLDGHCFPCNTFLHVFPVFLEESDCEICIFCSGFIPHLVGASRNKLVVI